MPNDITVTATHVSMCDPQRAAIKPRRYHETITAGQAVYVNASGEAALADASAAGTAQFRGIALQSKLAGEVGDIFEGGLGLGAEIEGFSVSALTPGDSLFLSDTAGALADASGTVGVKCGEVSCLTDPLNTQVVRICMVPNIIWGNTCTYSAQ